MKLFETVLLIGLILCAIACNFTKKLLPAVVVFMSYSTIMSIIWMILQSPDLAITEAAVGAGITSILFFVTLKKINGIDEEDEEREEKKDEQN